MSIRRFILALMIISALAVAGCNDDTRHTGYCKDGTMVGAPSYSKFRQVCRSHGGVA